MSIRILSSLLILASGAAFASPSDCIRDLAPTPRQCELNNGSFTFNLRTASFLLRTQSTEQSRRLGDRVAEVESRLGMTNAAMINEPFANGALGLAIFSGDKIPAQTGAAAPEEAKAEGYDLTITSEGVSISAESERGLFYGLMTAEQLFASAAARHETGLPCLHIVDWPSIGMRGYHEDYGRDQLPTVEDQKREIRLLAQYKMNTHLWFVEPDHFVYKFDPEIGKDYDRFTFDEVREVVAYAKEHYIEVIPVVESLAHMENTLSNPKYAGLAETPGSGVLCPTSDESFTLIKNIIGEIADAFDGKYFHCGLDESDAVGKGKSAEAVKTKGVERVYADYYKRLNDLVKSHGKTMMMYADIVLNHPKTMDLLPKDIVMMYWEYGDAPRHAGFDALAKNGFKTTSLSAVWDWVNLYPVYGYAFKNIQNLAAQTADVGAMGAFTADWGDGNLGAAGANLSELNYFGAIYLACEAWRPEPIPMAEFSRKFATQFFGTPLADSAEAFELLATCQDDTTAWIRRARMMFHASPEKTLPEMAKASEADLAFWRELKKDAARADALLAKVKPARNSDYYQSFDLAARQLEFAADMALQLRETADALAGKNFSGEEQACKYEALSTRQQKMWNEYREIYAATNRPINLKYLRIAWENSEKELANFAAALRGGEVGPASK